MFLFSNRTLLCTLTSCFFPTSHTILAIKINSCLLGFHFITHQLGKYISNQPPVKSKQVFTFTLSHLSGLNLHLEAILISISRSQLCKDKKVIFLPRQKRTLILICQKFKLMTKYWYHFLQWPRVQLEKGSASCPCPGDFLIFSTVAITPFRYFRNIHNSYAPDSTGDRHQKNISTLLKDNLSE